MPLACALKTRIGFIHSALIRNFVCLGIPSRDMLILFVNVWRRGCRRRQGEFLRGVGQYIPANGGYRAAARSARGISWNDLQASKQARMTLPVCLPDARTDFAFPAQCL